MDTYAKGCESSQSLLDQRIEEIKSKIYSLMDQQSKIRYQVDSFTGEEVKLKDETSPKQPEPNTYLSKLDFISRQLDAVIAVSGDNCQRLQKITGV